MLNNSVGTVNRKHLYKCKFSKIKMKLNEKECERRTY